MTNQIIILLESVKLMEEGKLQGSGRFTEIETPEGVKDSRNQKQFTLMRNGRHSAIRCARVKNRKLKSACGSIAEVSTRRMKKETKQ